MWKIPLYTEHICPTHTPDDSEADDTKNNQCLYTICKIKKNIVNIIQYKKCIQYRYLEVNNIHLKSFQFTKPQGNYGSLMNPDMIVIPDSKFSVKITYPLVVPVTIWVANTDNGPFRLRDIVLIIRQIYIGLYEKEEMSASVEKFNITRRCEECHELDIKTTLQGAHEADSEANDTCCICYEDYTTTTTTTTTTTNNATATKLRCNHIFHQKCISTWIDKAGKSCPLCREKIYKCSVCGDTKIIHDTIETKILPLKYRKSPFFKRNKTNGIFQIYDWDFDVLVLKSMIYNRLQKRLYPVISNMFNF
jgi:hypothetical protein